MIFVKKFLHNLRYFIMVCTPLFKILATVLIKVDNISLNGIWDFPFMFLGSKWNTLLEIFNYWICYSFKVTMSTLLRVTVTTRTDSTGWSHSLFLSAVMMYCWSSVIPLVAGTSCRSSWHSSWSANRYSTILLKSLCRE